jgi:hypothetical protein
MKKQRPSLHARCARQFRQENNEMNVQLSGPGGKPIATILAEHGFDQSESDQIAAVEAGLYEPALRDLVRRGLDSFPLSRALHLYGFINGFCLGLMLGGDEGRAAREGRRGRDVQLAWNHIKAVKASASRGEKRRTDVSMYDAVDHGEPWLAAILAEQGFDQGESGQSAAAEAGICERTWHGLVRREVNSPPLNRVMHLYGFIDGFRHGLRLGGDEQRAAREERRRHRSK